MPRQRPIKPLGPAIDDEVIKRGCITAQQAAEILNVSADFVYKLMETGKMRYLYLAPNDKGRGVRRIPMEWLKEFMSASLRGGWNL